MFESINSYKANLHKQLIKFKTKTTDFMETKIEEKSSRIQMIQISEVIGKK